MSDIKRPMSADTAGCNARIPDTDETGKLPTVSCPSDCEEYMWMRKIPEGITTCCATSDPCDWHGRLISTSTPQPLDGASDAITYNPVYGTVKEGAHPMQGIVYLPAQPDAEAPSWDGLEGLIRLAEQKVDQYLRGQDQVERLGTALHMLRQALLKIEVDKKGVKL